MFEADCYFDSSSTLLLILLLAILGHIPSIYHIFDAERDFSNLE